MWILSPHSAKKNENEEDSSPAEQVPVDEGSECSEDYENLAEAAAGIRAEQEAGETVF